jgi:predicted RecA/RadA family phage recombinase
MKTELQSGKTITVTRSAAAAVSSGDLVTINSKFFGVAAKGAPSTGDTFAAFTEGVYDLPKLAEGITQGSPLYWNGAALGATFTGIGAVGMAWETVATGATTVPTKINFQLPRVTGAI